MRIILFFRERDDEMWINYNDILEARNRIIDYVYLTPLDKSMYLSDEDTNIYLKLECQQRMKCAKLRELLVNLQV